MPSLETRLREVITTEYDQAEVRIFPAFGDELNYEPDPHGGGYWVTAQVYVSPMDLYPNPNPAWVVWACEDFSKRNDWSDFSDWSIDERYQCESDDDTGSSARRQARDRAKYLRQQRRLLVAVRPEGSRPLPLRPAKAG